MISQDQDQDQDPRASGDSKPNLDATVGRACQASWLAWRFAMQSDDNWRVCVWVWLCLSGLARRRW